jgi:alanyl-tRNA synthetase
MTQKLYYENAYTRTFTAKVIKEATDEHGVYVVLDKTAFYPTGGGQPCDKGRLNEVLVGPVEEVDGEIRHYLHDSLTLGKGTEVEGVIQWTRRFDHMQQHAGQHILSAAFAELYNIDTISFHLGNELLTIDLDVEALDEEVVRDAELLANRIIFENRTIEPRFVDADELATLPLRKAPTVQDNIRIVIIDNFDYNGCGGTHPLQTGEVGQIKVISWERHKQKVRLTFVCGHRALHEMTKKQSLLAQSARVLKCNEKDVPTKIENLLQTQKELEKALQVANESLLEIEAQELVRSHSTNIIENVFKQRSMQELQQLAMKITNEHPEAIVLFITEDSERLQLLCACGKQVTQSMNDIVKEVLPLIDGKGGGNKTTARGGGYAKISSNELLAALRTQLV